MNLLHTFILFQSLYTVLSENVNTDDTTDETLSIPVINKRYNVPGVEESDILTLRRKNSGGTKWTKTRKGPNGGLVRIPYVLSNGYSARQLATIRAAMGEFARYTCIRFVPRQREFSYISINDGLGCASHVGKTGLPAQSVTLAIPECVTKGTTMHELMHVIGFHHEHSRTDRDKHVRIIYNNIQRGEAYNFDKKTASRNLVVYDYNSIMHYGNRYLAALPYLRTVQVIPKHMPAPHIGQRNRLSPYDIEEIRYHYKCDARTYNHCGEDFIGRSSGSFQSPSYPAAYPKKSHCTWNITVRNDRYVKVTFANIDIHDSAFCQDGGILIHDGRDAAAPLLRRICETRSEVIEVTSSGRNMYIIFSSDNAQRRNRGFNATFIESTISGQPPPPFTMPTLPPIRQIVDRLHCNFERDLCGMTQDRSDNSNYLRMQGPTLSAGTGPSGDHTTGRGYYIYVESSSPGQVGDNAIIRTPWFDRNAMFCVSFSYHMLGSYMGGLRLYAFEKRATDNYGHEVLMWERHGNQGRNWINKDISYMPGANVESIQFYWEAIIYKYQSDIALDDIDVRYGRCTAPLFDAATTSVPTTTQTTTQRTTTTSTLPAVYSNINCTFDTDSCEFSQSREDHFDWSRRRGSTPSASTGPSGDHTTGRGYYMFVEASSPRRPGHIARLETPLLTPGKHCLHMWYHMYGYHTGNLTISQTINGVKTTIWVNHGNHGNSWHSVTLEVGEESSYNFNVAIEATIGRGHAGDIAIDDLLLTNNRCAVPNYQQNFVCNFESNLFCGMGQTGSDVFDWTRTETPGAGTPSFGTGPSGDHTPGLSTRGHFIYLEASSPRQYDDYADIETPRLAISTAKRCVTFWYHMYGDAGMGSLHVFADFVPPQRSGSVAVSTNRHIWSLSGDQGQRWNMASMEINQNQSYYGGYAKIRFCGSRGRTSRSDIAIDDICIYEGPCNNTSQCNLGEVLNSTATTTVSSLRQLNTTTTETQTASIGRTAVPSNIRPTAIATARNVSAVWSGMPLCTFEEASNQRQAPRQPIAGFRNNSRDLGEYVYPENIKNDVMCGWKQRSNDQFNWTRQAGSTPSYRTGPSGDHTNSRGHYLFIEASNPRVNNDVAVLQTYSMPPIPYCIDFYYHMFGVTIKRLSVRSVQKLTVRRHLLSYLRNIEGDQGNTWKNLRVNFNPRSRAESVAFLIEGVVGRDHRGDIAIDDTKILPGPCNACQSPSHRFVNNVNQEQTFLAGCANSGLFWVRCCGLNQEKAVYRRVTQCNANMFSAERLYWFCSYF